MKAKCPHCENGCDRCQDGFTVATFARGDLYTQHCDACNEDNGGRIDCFKDAAQWEKPQDCVWCGSPNTRWLLLAREDELGPHD